MDDFELYRQACPAKTVNGDESFVYFCELWNENKTKVCVKQNCAPYFWALMIARKG